MCDPSIPLTIPEWKEWGNPNEEKYFQYMLEYSPYDNIRHQKYPAIYITCSLHDPRVAYWEPAKWAARLREMNTGNNPILMKIDMSSGHAGASDRYKYLREEAEEISFVLDKICATELK
eukprot:CAMPEP_0113940890 /NCGR_PEP_ID=MMETSP1339-20121228/6920_1 /TAXON_ID=94617 /ORGANISM="Fibrocapsa japonica" /LENGTH=118 /DNA_ID=CAMNT_0000944861 /DNA_START=53 /DNA_END=409 /DNA_ORIENTATION=- /assembly_acc=CAM_ASM_000762